MSLLHLVRHGQASAGTDNYDRLSVTGQEQSRVLGAWWHSHGFAPNKAFHGTLVRQRDTAAHSLNVLGEGGHTVQPAAHPGLNEYDHRVIEAHFAPESSTYIPEAMDFAAYMQILSNWRDHKTQKKEPAVEPWGTFKARGWNTLRELSEGEAADSNIVFFTSGGVIATILATVLDLDFEHTVDSIWRIRNTSITTLKIRDGKARLVDFNTIAHLQEQRNPDLITLI